MILRKTAAESSLLSWGEGLKKEPLEESLLRSVALEILGGPLAPHT